MLWALFAFDTQVGGRLLVNLFYNELLGKYITTFLSYSFTSLLGDRLSGFFIGPYGILTTGLAYACAVLLPVMAAFFFIYALLYSCGYISRLSLTFNRLLKLLGLNGYALPALLFSCCKITGLKKSSALHTSREQRIMLLLLLFGLPCVTQLIIILNLLSILPANYALIFLGVMLGQFFLLLGLHNMLPQPPSSVYVDKVVPLHFPDLSRTCTVTGIYLRWYLHSIVPLLLGVSALLWAAQITGLLGLLRELCAPLIGAFLDLPPSFTDSIVLGLFRKDFGAASLYDLANNGMLNSIQVLVSTLFIALTFPCLGLAGEVRRQYGWRWALALFFLTTLYAFIIAAAVNKILRIYYI